MGTINQTSIVLVWFKRDLRISDHEPLIAAIATGLPIMPVYVVETDYWQTSVASRRHWCFLRDCLESLDQMLHTNDQSLVIRVDQDAQMAFDKLAQSYDIKTGLREQIFTKKSFKVFY